LPTSGGTTISTTGVKRVFSGSKYKEAYKSNNDWWIDVMPTVNGTEYTAIPLKVSDVYTKGYEANSSTPTITITDISPVSGLLFNPEKTFNIPSNGDYTVTFNIGDPYNVHFNIGNGSTPSTPSTTYIITDQEFWVDEYSYTNGYDYNGTSSKVAINGRVKINNSSKWVSIKKVFDIPVGSVWANGKENGGSTGGGGNSNYGYSVINFRKRYEPGTGWKYDFRLAVYDGDNHLIGGTYDWYTYNPNGDSWNG